MLEVRDNLQLATQHADLKKAKTEEDIKAVKTMFESTITGMEMTASVMDKVLKRFGVVQVDPTGDKFDPNCHEAIFMMPNPD